MWAQLPDVLVAHVAMLAPPVLLPALSQVDKRCHASVSERLTNLAALRMPPFNVHIDVILGTSNIGAAMPDWGGNAISDANMEVLARACASGAMAQLTVSSHPTALESCLDTWHACSSGPARFV